VTESSRIASDEQIAAAAAAVTLGMALAAEYHSEAGETPGLGWQVSLPSAPGVQGEGYNLPAGTPALSSPAPKRLIPDYGAPAVGGAGHHSTSPAPGSPTPFDGVAWPSGRSSAIAYVSPRSRPALSTRIRSAWRTLLGRR
jgi:hypothetical protein